MNLEDLAKELQRQRDALAEVANTNQRLLQENQVLRDGFNALGASVGSVPQVHTALTSLAER
eukprot:4687317-Karenia_brevis.AAC.1